MLTYIIADPDVQSGIELKELLNRYAMLEFGGSYTTLAAAEVDILSHPPDMALIRLGNAALNAFRLADEIRQQNPLTKVIFFGSQKEDAVEAFEYGADGFLLVPFSKMKIEQLLQQSMVEKMISSDMRIITVEKMGE